MREKAEEKNTIIKETATEVEVQVQIIYTGRIAEVEQAI